METVSLVEGNGSARWIARNRRDACDGRVLKAANKMEAAWLTGSHASLIDLLASESSQPRLDATALARQRIDRRPRPSWLQAACPASLPPTPTTPTPSDNWQSARSIRPDQLLHAVRKTFNGFPHGG